MQIKYSQLRNSIPAINDLLNQKLNIIISYKMLILKELIESEITKYNNKEQELIRSYIKLNDQGVPVLYVDETGKEDPTKYQLRNTEELQNKIKEMREDTITLQFELIPLSSIKDVTIEPAKLPLIDWLIDPNR